MQDQKPDVYALSPNYPNPFNPSTHFSYALVDDSYVTLTIYNTLGQLVAKVVDEFQTAGYKSVEFDATSLPSGFYYYKLEAGGFSEVKKMLLVR